MTGYDIIGDVHGCADDLERLLHKLGYAPDADGAFHHPRRSLIFVGDLIDRGPGQLRVLKIVKTTADAGAALVTLGNHEFNAMAFDAEWPAGSARPLRPHSAKNTQQHAAFLEQVPPPQRAHYLSWFRTLPVWLDLGGLRVVHACWHPDSIRVVQRELDGARFTSTEQIAHACDPAHPLYIAIETLLKGPELDLRPYGLPPYLDKGNHTREQARLRWWVEDAVSVAELAMIEPTFTTRDGSPYPELPDVEVPAADRNYVYTGDVPVFFGHYWRRGAPEERLDWSASAACLDFSVAKGGALTAYRWSGETRIEAGNFVQLS